MNNKNDDIVIETKDNEEDSEFDIDEFEISDDSDINQSDDESNEKY